MGERYIKKCMRCELKTSDAEYVELAETAWKKKKITLQQRQSIHMDLLGHLPGQPAPILDASQTPGDTRNCLLVAQLVYGESIPPVPERLSPKERRAFRSREESKLANRTLKRCRGAYRDLGMKMLGYAIIVCKDCRAERTRKMKEALRKHPDNKIWSEGAESQKVRSRTLKDHHQDRRNQEPRSVLESLAEKETQESLESLNTGIKKLELELTEGAEQDRKRKKEHLQKKANLLKLKEQLRRVIQEE